MTESAPSSGPVRVDPLRRRASDWDRVAVVAIVVGAALRILWILVVHPPASFIYSDMAGYVRRAAQLASGAPLTPGDAFFPPGTDVLLSIPLGLFGIEAGMWAAAVSWCLLSIATVYLSWRLTRELLTPAAAALTTALCAVWPLHITYGGYFTSETPALAFLVAALWAGVVATRRVGRQAAVLALLAGILGGVASAVRPQLLINVALLLLFVVIASRRKIAPASCLATGVVAVIALVVVHNSIATNHLTGLATNGGLNFWFGHCEARQVTTFDTSNRRTVTVRHPVPRQAGRGGDYVAVNHDVWDDDYFVRLGWACIEKDGPEHVLRLARNVLDMTATTVPWPQNEDEGWSREVVKGANLLYSILLPCIVIGSLLSIRRRRKEGARSGEVFMLMNLACAVVVAIVVIGDPRVRAVYDVFGFALLSSLLVGRLHLGGTEEAELPTSDTGEAPRSVR